MDLMERFQTIEVRSEDALYRIRFNRPEARNTINDRLIEECHQALDEAESNATVVILEGSPEIFCFGADFQGMQAAAAAGNGPKESNPEPLYALWQRLATGPFATVAHVRGLANAGGIGFVAACDVVVADVGARFSLSELLFGLLPACVLPFLIRRIGHQRAHYLTLMTQPISAEQALQWGLADAIGPDSEAILRKHLLRLRRLSKPALTRYKNYQSDLSGFLTTWKPQAIAANQAVFADRRNMEGILRYVETGKFPWEP